jgi:hypothetical protein
MRPKLQKSQMTSRDLQIIRLQSALKFASRIIPHSGGYDIPKLALGYYTRDIKNTSYIFSILLSMRKFINSDKPAPAYLFRCFQILCRL